MFFNFFLILFWLLAFVSPVGDYTQYTKLLSDTRYTVPDKHTPAIMVSALSPLIMPPAPVPGPRYTPLVIPPYSKSIKPEEAWNTRFSRRTRVIGKSQLRRRVFSFSGTDISFLAIFKFVEELIDHLSNLVGRPRPTKTSKHPGADSTKSLCTTSPAPPAPASRDLKHSSTSTRSTSGIDLEALWDTYKLLVGWFALTCVATVFNFVRFIVHASILNGSEVVASADSPLIPRDSLATFDSILDIYSSLPPSDTGGGLATPSNTADTVPEDVTLQDVSIEELIALVLADYATTTPGSAASNVANAPLTDIDTKSRVGGPTDTHGTLEGGKILEPALEINSIGSVVQLSSRESSASCSVSYHLSSGSSSNIFDLKGKSASASYLPVSVSKDSIDVQMDIMLGEQQRMIFDQKLGARYNPILVSGLIPVGTEVKVEDRSALAKLARADVPLPPGTSIEYQAAIGPIATLPPSPSLEEGY
ncbi:hypothetical protein OPQ81_008422 [Rhizoctonia solani]|nr:hypothetical protein OPQ81_008422 [Rhizoctonia solani]